MFKRIFLELVAVALVVSAVAGEDVDLADVANARVTIPYSELKELWKAAQQNNRPPPPKPPVGAELISARYEIELRGNEALGVVEIGQAPGGVQRGFIIEGGIERGVSC